MSYRTLHLSDGTEVKYVIGRTFVKVRGRRKAIPISECEIPMGKGHFVTPAAVKAFLETGKRIVTDAGKMCEKHDLPLEWKGDPYSAEIEDNYTPHLMCAHCAQESAWDI